MAGRKQKIMALDRAHRSGYRWKDAQKTKWTGHRPYRFGVGNKAMEGARDGQLQSRWEPWKKDRFEGRC